MGTQLDKTRSRALDAPASGALRERRDGTPAPVELSFNAFPFFSFHYSYREISSIGGQTHVKARDVHFTNGKLETEAFEGTTGAGSYETMLQDVQAQMFAPMRAFLEQWSRFLSK